MAGSDFEPDKLAWRLFAPALALAALTAILVLALAFGGEGHSASLAPLAALSTLAALGLLLWARHRLKVQALLPIARLQTALKRVPEQGAVAVRAVKDPGALTGLVREISALLEACELLDQPLGEGEESAVRTRLESVLRNLHDGVLICTLEHQVLLYNHRALEILQVSGEVGLDRTLFQTLAERPFRHGITRLLARFQSGRHESHDDGLSLEVIAGTVDGGLTIKGRMSLMLDDAGDQPVGYVLTFEDGTAWLASALHRERNLFDLRDDLQKRLDDLSAKASDSDLSDDVAGLAGELERLDGFLLDAVAGAWPTSAVFSTTLFHCIAQRQSEGRALTFTVEGDPVWLHCDSTSVTDLLDRLANRLAVDFEVQDFRLMATLASDNQAYVELFYTGPLPDEHRLAAWLDEPLEPDLGAVTGADILHHHRTAFSVDDLTAGRATQIARLRLPLGIAQERYARSERSPQPAQARHEFYDFELLERPSSGAQDSQPLRALTSIAFDTETTGLEPSKGDEIICLGAARIVNGRLLRGEIFNEFVNPQRRIPAASTKIHGITDVMVADAPVITQTLPRFHRFVGQAALIAHNAAFDMSFLALKEESTGVRFDQPVLDTLLLAAHALGREESLSLDALAARFGLSLPPEDRHTALGDALATGSLFLALLPLLEAKGVVTLGDALAASKRQVGLRRMQANF